MTQNQSSNNKDQQQQKGATEDPTNNATKQNKPGKEKEGSAEVEVPKEAVESYKESGKEGEE